ncbi:hypothetical protein R1sor_017662 [Riccia sorocarpa]|uniref:Uncharacterized protein n=1 Tax=Riccia sorocarpa TaxID=122646 RepID=A0ABD3IB20_9MARC
MDISLAVGVPGQDIDDTIYDRLALYVEERAQKRIITMERGPIMYACQFPRFDVRKVSFSSSALPGPKLQFQSDAVLPNSISMPPPIQFRVLLPGEMLIGICVGQIAECR